LLDAVAAQTAAPGGGSAAGWTAAMAASLVEMAARFTLARAEFEHFRTRASEIATRAEALRAEALALAERELHAYAPVLEAMKLPAEVPDRRNRVRAALSEAADSPLGVARAATELSELATELARTGNPHLEGDAVTGALLAEAACRAAVALVQFNLGHAPEDARFREARQLARRAYAARREALFTAGSRG
jgi:formiminotetrahydrofolate cyclodeaminase